MPREFTLFNPEKNNKKYENKSPNETLMCIVTAHRDCQLNVMTRFGEMQFATSSGLALIGFGEKSSPFMVQIGVKAKFMRA